MNKMNITFYDSELKNLKKSYLLLKQRGVIGTAQSELEPGAFEDWLNAALIIQSSIYMIDSLYENETTIDTIIEKPMWKKVLQNISESEGSHNCDIGIAFEDLQRYADAERRIHAFDLIDSREFESILTLKCSDVRISRSLIWNYSKCNIGKRERNFWSVHDQCWELIEDLQDISEDGKDWNFNFWLYTFMAGHSANDGIRVVEQLLEFKAIILENIFISLPNSINPIYKIALESTFNAIYKVKSDIYKIFIAIKSGKVIRFKHHIQYPILSFPKENNFRISAIGGT